jgi:ATP-dependent protease ClpP protease subunit
VVEDTLSYLEVADRSLARIGGQACDAALRNATATIELMLNSTGGAAQLTSAIGLM